MTRVDVSGEVCPRPALIVRKRLSELEVGDRLLVRGDYPPAERNLCRMCRKRGFTVAKTEDGTDGDAFELRIEVTEGAEIPEA
ncbi:SirA family protein (plasmid) [Haloterrigena turkmenica DSM 5511]|uniref:SirA family protein n=1 Tax=Haloterrigena turkmenica (strain ATCC 51198 / DSM 5511 / JCM 9101 / NCIMB 13204 / VKM B-1734 / 4k) TaxID=543526 RepID=D2S092_HALTV|nr:sulfurtransferase TusA family protein [Haloterrigena turkmenica]ADB62789.1 SirA family protein [Haloterrigena turkmenica DSM 5511]